MSTILKTRIALVDQDAQERLKDTIGKEPRRGDLEESIAEIYIDLLDVTAVRQAYDLDGKLEEDECHLYFGDGHYAVLTPFEEVAKQWLATREDTAPAPSIDVSQAVATLARALDEDKSEGSLYYGYQSNIAMAIKATYRTHAIIKDPLFENVDDFANQAAKNFLDQLINSIK